MPQYSPDMDENVVIRTMDESDYEEVHNLWMGIRGFGIRSIDDSRDGVIRFIHRNPDTSIVAVEDGRIVGSILCGHDGRSACFYHVCVREDCRRRGIGRAMVGKALLALQAEHINKVTLIAFTNNEVGNLFWKNTGWRMVDNANMYEFTLNKENITNFNI